MMTIPTASWLLFVVAAFVLGMAAQTSIGRRRGRRCVAGRWDAKSAAANPDAFRADVEAWSGECCQRCGECGSDRRNLWVSCLSNLVESSVPFREYLFADNPAGPRRLYMLRICKDCRAEFIATIERWHAESDITSEALRELEAKLDTPKLSKRWRASPEQIDDDALPHDIVAIQYQRDFGVPEKPQPPPAKT